MTKEQVIAALKQLGAYCDELERLKLEPDLQTALNNTSFPSLNWVAEAIHHPALLKYRGIVHGLSWHNYWRGRDTAWEEYSLALRNTTLDEWLELISKAVQS